MSQVQHPFSPQHPLSNVSRHDHLRYIRMFKAAEKELNKLEPVLAIQYHIYYIDSLFASALYQELDEVIDPIIEKCIYYNIESIEGYDGDIYIYLLLRKAIVSYRLKKYDVAMHVSGELIKIDPETDFHPKLYRLAAFKKRGKWVKLGMVLGQVFLTLAVLSSLIDLFFVSPYYPSWHNSMEMLTTYLFVSAMTVCATCFCFTWWMSGYDIRRFQRKLANK